MNKGIEPLNDKGQRHGYCEVYYDDGSLLFKSYYINGELSGYDEDYFLLKPTIFFHL